MPPGHQGMKAGVVVQEAVVEMVTRSFGAGDRFADQLAKIWNVQPVGSTLVSRECVLRQLLTAR